MLAERGIEGSLQCLVLYQAISVAAIGGDIVSTFHEREIPGGPAALEHERILNRSAALSLRSSVDPCFFLLQFT